MAFRLKILPSALREKQWLCETYGSEFCGSLNRWCERIAECVPDQMDTLCLIPIEEVLDAKHKPWSYVWSELRDRTVSDRLRSLLTFLKTLKPPFEVVAAQARFFTQERFWVNVIAVTKIDRVDNEVTVTLLTWYGDEH